jgi:DUF1680 family protein
MLQPFPYHDVSLQDSRMKMQFDEVRDFYLRLPNDDLLRGYRLRAGLPAPGADLGGCYIGHNTFGQVLSGLARMYAVTRDFDCKSKAEALMSEWAKCIEPDGFFFIEKNPGLPPYYYDKMVCGLVDLYVYCDNREALAHLSRITDWAVAHLDRSRLYARPTGEGGGEWYTLSENLYRAYQVTHDEKYFHFARIWEYTEFWDLIANKQDIFQHPMNGGWYHAYSHVNSLNGLGAAYAVAGDPRHLDTLKNGYDFLWDSQLWVTGGFGPNETLMPRPKLADMLRETNNHFETQCGTWAGFKMSKYLQTFTGDARYGDWIELLAINGIGASIPMDPDGGVFYYSEYNLAGSAKQNMAPWACCSGTRPQALAEFCNLIYFKDGEGLYVNLFTPSTVEWMHPERSRMAQRVTLEQETNFPESSGTTLVLRMEKPATFSIRVRVPGWLSAPMQASTPVQSERDEGTIGTKPVPFEIDEHGWAVFHREWHNNDRINIYFPREFRTSPLLKDKPYPTAITFGPVTMVARSLDGNPSKKFDFANLPWDLKPSSESPFVPLKGEPLNYRLNSDPNVLLRPFYQMKKGERYFMYLDPECTVDRVSRTAATFSPGWIDFGGWHATNTIGSSAQYTFQGDSITLIGQLYDDAGRIEVKIDGNVVGVVDQYGPNRGEPKRWDFSGLGNAEHTLVLTLLPDKAEASKGNYVNLTGFEFSG